MGRVATQRKNPWNPSVTSMSLCLDMLTPITTTLFIASLSVSAKLCAG